jgi:hypothetical protein
LKEELEGMGRRKSFDKNRKSKVFKNLPNGGMQSSPGILGLQKSCLTAYRVARSEVDVKV